MNKLDRHWDRIASALMIRFNADVTKDDTGGFVRITLSRRREVIAYSVLPLEAVESALGDPFGLGLDGFIDQLSASLEDQVRAYSPAASAYTLTIFEYVRVGGLFIFWLDTTLPGLEQLIDELPLYAFKPRLAHLHGSLYQVYWPINKSDNIIYQAVRRCLELAYLIESASEFDPSTLPDPPIA